MKKVWENIFMGAFEALTKYYENPLIMIALDLGYDGSNLLILDGNEEKLKSLYPEIYSNLETCAHNADRRNVMEYGKDLVASWIFEDVFLRNMKETGLDISLAGADRIRKILSKDDVSSESDYLVRINDGLAIKMELASDYQDFMFNFHKLDLRDDKYPRLTREKSLLLAIHPSLGNGRFALFDFRQEIKAEYIACHPVFEKPAYRLDVPEDKLFRYTFENVKNKIIEVMS